MIPVTKPYLPPKEEYQRYLDGIWQRNWLTNNGPLVNELELRLKRYLVVPHLLFVGNGTLALQIAIKALGLKDEVITTPFSYVATTSSLVWEGCTPVFVDIDPETLNIDPAKIEAAITNRTTGILATHVYGNPCDIDTIDTLAKKYNLKIIYDAAHCFGTKYKGISVFNFGDISATSFHATKLYHTIEGGGVITRNPELLKKMAFLRNFGYNGPEDFAEVGINGKNSEFHAAMGLCTLDHVDEILMERKLQSARYDYWLKDEKGIKQIRLNAQAEFNHAYYPIILENEETVKKVMEYLEGAKIFPRRYFYPSLNTVKIYERDITPISTEVSKKVLCLPLFAGLSSVEIDFVCRIILRTLRHV